MKKKRLNEGCACEGEERAPKHEEFISGDKVSRYILQMTDEEQDRVEDFREVLAGILKTKPENIKGFKRSGLGYRVKFVGDMDDLEGIMDDNVDVLKRLKGAEDEEWSDDEEDDDMNDIQRANMWRDYQDDDDEGEFRDEDDDWNDIQRANRWRDYRD